jgi:predicted nucleic-acid-binding Zn-ribbon protein
MSFSPKPCSHCGGTSFHVLPDLLLEAHKAVVSFGMTAGSKIPGWWRLTLVVCTQCTRTEFFTPNIAELASRVDGDYVVNASR